MSCDLGVCCQEGQVIYFYGSLPVFRHRAEDVKSFRMFTSQLYVEGKVKQADVARVFGVSKISIKRWVKVYREQGPAGFWKPRRVRGGTVLKPEVLKQAQQRFDEGIEWAEVAAELGVRKDTMRKALRDGRLRVGLKKRKPVVKSRVASRL